MHWTESGPRPLDWGELAAWQAMTQTALTPWQAATIRHLSCVYAQSAGAATDPLCPPPMAVPTDHDRVAAQVKAIFGAFAARSSQSATEDEQP